MLTKQLEEVVQKVVNRTLLNNSLLGYRSSTYSIITIQMVVEVDPYQDSGGTGAEFVTRRKLQKLYES
jgi:hypothetical protein